MKEYLLRRNIALLSHLLENLDGYHFDFYVLSAAPEEVIQSALDGIVPPERICGTRFRYDPTTGEIASIVRVPAGYGKVAVLEKLRYLTPIAKRTVLGDNALGVLVPILEEIVGWDSTAIRALFERHGLVLQEWDKVRTDSVTIRETAGVGPDDR